MNVPTWIATPTVGQVDSAADQDPASGVEGNSKLTSATGMVLLVLLAVEGVTILSVRQMITLHIFVGVLLLGPVLLKSGSTMYRFARYYAGDSNYRRKGPPAPLLRVIGPLVVLSSLALLGTGIVLIVVGTNGSGALLTAHQASFWIWVALMTVHVLGHLWEAAVTSWSEIRGSFRGPLGRRRRWRYTAIVAALVIGVGAATALLPTASSWIDRPTGHISGHAGARPTP